MTSRRDQLQSYQFMNQRVISAFVMRETDPAQSPLRRGVGALFAGLMVAVLVAAGFGVYGLLTRTGDTRWQAEGSVVVERESGATFVYLGDRLVPTLNLASAKLAAGRRNPPVFRIPAGSLTGTPRGALIGIPNAPDSLPAADRQARLPWTACTAPPAFVLLIAAEAPAATPLAGRGLLLTDGNLSYLVTQGRKHRIRSARTTTPALFGATRPVEVSPTWLTGLPDGPDIAPLDVDDQGAPSGAVAGRDNGDILFTETASGRQFYLVLGDGLAAISPLQQAVQSAADAVDPEEIPVSEVSQVPASDALAGTPQPPATVPELAPLAPGQAACATTRTAAEPPALSVGAPASAFADAIPTAANEAVQVPAGRYALLRSSGGFILVTDQARRHAVPSEEALSRLGYSPDTAEDVPPALFDPLPEGPELDPAAALRPAANPN